MLAIRLDCSTTIPLSCCFPLVKAGTCKFAQYDPTDSLIQILCLLEMYLQAIIVYMLFTILLCSVKYLSLTLPSQPSEIKHTVPCGVIFMYRECLCAQEGFLASLSKQSIITTHLGQYFLKFIGRVSLDQTILFMVHVEERHDITECSANSLSMNT